MADAATQITDAVGLLFFFYSALAVVMEAVLDLAADVAAIQITDAIPSSGFYLFFAAAAAEVSKQPSAY